MIKSGPAIAVWKRKRILKAGQSEISVLIPQSGCAAEPVAGWSVANDGGPSNARSSARGFACK